MVAVPANDRRYCSVIALASVTGKSTEQAARVLARLGRRPGEAVYTGQILDALELLGFDYAELPHDQIPKTLRSCEWYLASTSRWLILTVDHAAAMVKGKVTDWTRGSLRRPVRVFRVFRLGGR